MSRGRILIVEDESIVAEDLRMSLEERGYEVLEMVFDPEKAIVKCREGLPDLILMDIYLRNATDGIELVRAIKAEFGIPVVHLTGWLEDCRPTGPPSQEPDLYVKKPFSEEELCAVIESALKHRRRKSR